jgi:hypothetical protein
MRLQQLSRPASLDPFIVSIFVVAGDVIGATASKQPEGTGKSEGGLPGLGKMHAGE